MGHIIEVRVNYADTDAGGVVYYANYLKYFEIGRTEYLREKGISLGELMKENLVFTVKNVTCEYISPARYDDLIRIKTKVAGVEGVRISFEHEILRAGTDEVLAKGRVLMVPIDTLKMRPVRIPPKVLSALGVG
jgi:acyl-CoA thioester hydrolase